MTDTNDYAALSLFFYISRIVTMIKNIVAKCVRFVGRVRGTVQLRFRSLLKACFKS